MIVSAEDLPDTSLIKLLQLPPSQLLLDVEVELLLVGVLDKPGDVLEDDNVIDSEGFCLLQLLSKPRLVLRVKVGHVGRVLVKLRVENNEAAAVLVK